MAERRQRGGVSNYAIGQAVRPHWVRDWFSALLDHPSEGKPRMDSGSVDPCLRFDWFVSGDAHPTAHLDRARFRSCAELAPPLVDLHFCGGNEFGRCGRKPPLLSMPGSGYDKPTTLPSLQRPAGICPPVPPNRAPSLSWRDERRIGRETAKMAAKLGPNPTFVAFQARNHPC